jgi:putative restriction endonuclease
MSRNEYQKTIRDIEALSYYAKKFQRLRVDLAHGVAPHKPILLLSVIEQIRREVIKINQIYLSPALTQAFLKYWSYLGSFNHHPDISRPFFHMRSGEFWHLWANPGYVKLISSKEKLKTLVEVKQAIKYAYLD